MENDLAASRDLAKRYHDMYMQEKEKNSEKERCKSRAGKEESGKKDEEEPKKAEKTKGKPAPEPKPAEEPPQRARTAPASSQRGEHVTDADLQDDEALFKRHVEMIAETKSMRTTTPIRIPDVIRKSEVSLCRLTVIYM
jgi:hypothetical protein